MVVQYEFVRNESVDLVFNNVLIYHPNYGWHPTFGWRATHRHQKLYILCQHI